MVASHLSSPFHSTQQSRITKKMSITQTYFLAHKARGKLSHEAARPDHNLRLLVGHANLLDSLMLDLAEAERDQEAWFNQSIKSSAPKAAERHVQWADAIPEAAEEDWEADSDSDSDSDLDEEEDDVEMADIISLRRVPSNTAAPASPRMQPLDDDEEEEDDEEEDYAALSLTRSPSHSASPPELDDDSDSSEDESMPPSPPFASLPSFSEKQREALSTVYYTSHQDEEDQKADFYNDGYYLPPRNPARLVSAISVY